MSTALATIPANAPEALRSNSLSVVRDFAGKLLVRTKEQKAQLAELTRYTALDAAMDFGATSIGPALSGMIEETVAGGREEIAGVPVDVWTSAGLGIAAASTGSRALTLASAGAIAPFVKAQAKRGVRTAKTRWSEARAKMAEQAAIRQAA